MLSFSRSESADELQDASGVRLLIASIQIDTDVIGHRDELYFEHFGETRTILAVARARRCYDRLLSGVQFEAEYVAVLVEELRDA